MNPLTGEYPFYTPYQYAGNRPINAIDLDGLGPVPSQAPGGQKVESGCEGKLEMGFSPKVIRKAPKVDLNAPIQQEYIPRQTFIGPQDERVAQDRAFMEEWRKMNFGDKIANEDRYFMLLNRDRVANGEAPLKTFHEAWWDAMYDGAMGFAGALEARQEQPKLKSDEILSPFPGSSRPKGPRQSEVEDAVLEIRGLPQYSISRDSNFEVSLYDSKGSLIGYSELKNGTFALGIQTKNAETGELITDLNGKGVFLELYFSTLNPLGEIEVVEGNWSKGSNFDAFHDNVKNKGMNFLDAAKNTPSGAICSQLGLNMVNVTVQPSGQISATFR